MDIHTTRTAVRFSSLLTTAMLLSLLSACATTQLQQLQLAVGYGATQYNPKLGKTQFSGTVDKSDHAVSIAVISVIPMTQVFGQSVGGGASASQSRNSNLLLELGYVDLGDYNFNGTWTGVSDVGTDSASAIKAAVGYEMPVNKTVSIFGKVGVTRWRAKVEEVFGGAPESSSDSGSSALLGLGVNYRLNPNWGLRLEWERHSDVWDTDDADVLSLNLVYHFGSN